MLSFKPIFSLSSFTFVKRLFSSFLLSAIRVVSSAYLGLLIFLPAILIPACASSSPTFHIMYSARSEERRVGKEWKQCQTLFFGAPKSLQMVTAAMKLKDACSLEGKL